MYRNMMYHSNSINLNVSIKERKIITEESEACMLVASAVDLKIEEKQILQFKKESSKLNIGRKVPGLIFQLER